MTYASDRADFEYLEAIAEVEDMVHIDASVWDLMRDPSKAHAAKLYQSSIRLWFAEHSDRYHDDPRVAEIAERAA